MRVPPSFLVDDHDAAVLQRWANDPAQPALALRAQIVLLCHDGHGPAAVATRRQCSKQTVISWRNRYIAHGLDGLRDAPRSGRPVTVDPAAVVLATLQRPDPPWTRWSTRSLGAALGLSNGAVAKVWRDWGIRPRPGGRVSLCTQPALDAAVLGVVGLHIAPPLHLAALVVTDPRTVAIPVGAAKPPLAPRRGLGTLLDDVILSAERANDRDRHTGAREFLERLDHAHPTIGAAASTRPNPPAPPGPPIPARTALIAAGDTALLRDLIGDCGHAALHTVATAATWTRMVRVGCLLAGATQDGAASLTALRTAMAAHHEGPFTWTRPQRPRSSP